MGDQVRPRVFSPRPGLVQYLLLLVLFGLGIGLRLINLTNPPLDFHAWRQLRAASIARAMYYESNSEADPVIREKAIALEKGFEVLEPRVFERVVALTYLVLGGEHLWVARLYSILFWSLGGVGVFLIAKKLTSFDGALVSTGVFLLLPYGVTASRSFQPDPLMVTWTIWTVYSLLMWAEKRTWAWSILAGFCGGVAVLIKVFAVFVIAVVAILTVLSNISFKSALKNVRVWSMAFVMIAIPSAYYIFQVGGLAPGYIREWTVSFGELWISPSFYIRWMNFLHSLFDLTVVFGAFLGLFFLQGPGRFSLLGWWSGYLLIGLSVPSLIITHDYYNLSLIPVLAVSLAPIGELIFQKFRQQEKPGQLLLAALLVIAIGFSLWLKRNDLVALDYREEVKGWVKMGKELPQDARIIGITHDYNTRIGYYGWAAVSPWPLAGGEEMHVLSGGNIAMDDPSWKDVFYEKTQGYDYFLVTKMGELDQQPVLKEILSQYPFIDGEGYLLYDLQP